MTRINFEVSDFTAMKFKDFVGEGNISETLREYVEKLIYHNSDEKQLEKEIELSKNQIDTLNIELRTFEIQLNKLKEVKQAELETINQEKELFNNQQKELYSYDPFIDLEGRNKLNEAQRTLYRVEKGKFIPEWAVKRFPENQKQFALDILNKIIKETKEVKNEK
jgi:hypothetical protein